MLLFPEQNLGLFVSYNSDTRAQARSELTTAFLDHYFPVSDARPNASRVARLARYTGTYAPLRVSLHSLAKVVLLLSATPVRAVDGYLVIPGAHGMRRFGAVGKEAVGEGFFREVDGRETLLFKGGTQDAAATMHLGAEPPMTLRRVAVWQSPNAQLGWFALCEAVFLWALIGLPVAAWRARRAARGGPVVEHDGDSLQDAIGTVGAWLVCGLFLAFAVSFIGSLSNPVAIVFDDQMAGVVRALWLPLLALPALAVATWATWRGYRQRRWSAGRRRGMLIVILAALAFLLWLAQWNLLGFQYRII